MDIVDNLYKRLDILLSARGYDKGTYFTHVECTALWCMWNAYIKRAERAEAMVERLIEAGERLSIHSRMVDDIDVWNALVAEWRGRNDR